MKINRIGTWFILGGLLLVAAALWLTGSNLWQGQQAGEASSRVLGKMAAQNPEMPTQASAEAPEQTEPTVELAIPDYMRNPAMEMPTQEIEGQTYVGVVDIPALELSLPVINEWSYPRLRVAPCRYMGSAYLNDLIIMAHNYRTHFGTLLDLQLGDDVYFTDMTGNVFHYAVIELETLGGTEVEEMISGDWDLTLFTCTVGGRTRVTVRCERTES